MVLNLSYNKLRPTKIDLPERNCTCLPKIAQGSKQNLEKKKQDIRLHIAASRSTGLKKFTEGGVRPNLTSGRPMAEWYRASVS